MIRCSLHNHTCYCDGKNTPEGVVLSAIVQELETVGISEHSPFPREPEAGMALSAVPAYRQEVLALREKYEDRIWVALGLEQDIFSPPTEEAWDFVIGSVHYIESEGRLYGVDISAEDQARGIEEGFGGDPKAFAKRYFETVALVVEKTNCDIIGHLDLLTKYNEVIPRFDTKSVWYRRMVSDTLDALLPADRIFEINAGAMNRGLRSLPYPGEWTLREMNRRGARITLSSDAHEAENVDRGFARMAAYAKACGYHTAWVLGKNGWKEETL